MRTLYTYTVFLLIALLPVTSFGARKLDDLKSSDSSFGKSGSSKFGSAGDASFGKDSGRSSRTAAKPAPAPAPEINKGSTGKAVSKNSGQAKKPEKKVTKASPKPAKKPEPMVSRSDNKVQESDLKKWHRRADGYMTWVNKTRDK